MIDVTLALILDVFVAGLLVMAIWYSARLNRRIKVLQDSKSELAQLIQEFDESTQRATEGINEIHRASKKIHQNIQMKLDKANYIADDLAFMIEKSSKMTRNLEASLPSEKGGKAAAAPASARRGALSAPRGRTAPAEEPEGANEEAAPRSPRGRPIPVDKASEAAADAGGKAGAMLKRLGRNKGGERREPASGIQKAAEDSKRRMSRSEQELRDALSEKY